MRKLVILSLFAGLCALLLSSPSGADCRRVVRVRKARRAVPVVEKVVEYPQYYQAVYDPTYGQREALLVEQLKSLDLRLQVLQQQLQRLQSGQGSAPARSMPRADHDPFAPQSQRQSLAIRLFGTRCARCHEARVAKAKGGGFALLDGGRLADLTAEQVNRVVARTYAGEMPPDRPLTDQEQAVVMEWLSEWAE